MVNAVESYLEARYGDDDPHDPHAIEPRASAAASCTATLADALVDMLFDNGIDTYFGVAGGAIEPFFDALARARDRGRARLITTRSEAGAGFAADGYYRASGRMAVCTATTGPGISNLLTALMNAHADRVPMIVITPQVGLAKQGRGALQDSSEAGYDLVRVLQTATVYSSQVTHPEQLIPKLLQALTRAATAPCGPVHLSIPSDLLASMQPLVMRRAHVSQPQWPLTSTPHEALETLWHAITHARNPVFYVGDDAGPDAMHACQLATALDGQVISSPAGKRWLEHTAPRYAGVLGFSGHASALGALRAADLVVAFGATFDELSTNAWTALPTVRTFVVDAHTSFAYRVPHARPIVVPPGLALRWLGARVPTRASALESQIMTLPTPPRSAAAGTPLHPTDLMRWLNQTLPESVVVHVDTGNSFSWSTRDMVRPQVDTYRVSMGLATMGWAIAASLGAAVASRERTLCITGDGAMLMSSLELSVAVQERLPLTYVVLNDAGFGMVKHGQRLAGAASIGHELGAVHFELIARALGAEGFRVSSLDELERIPRHYFEAADHGPCLIDVVIDGEAVPPMVDRVLGLQSGIPK